MRPVTAPHYGDTLFHFYQDKYFSAVTGLMVSQHFTRLAPHDDDSEILRGGLLLSYGMHREAGQIFAQLIERGAPPKVRDRAWYYLAKIRWQRGLNADAESALAKIEGKLPGELEDDRGLLQANLLMARNEFAGAAEVLRGMAPKDNAKKPSQASLYARFNLGVALVKSGDVAGGSALLDEVGRMPGADEEQRSLRDRANVALGFAALQDGRSDDARTVLQRVRLQSLQE
jgi:tetratricopeptide (TPR) repeat protein